MKRLLQSLFYNYTKLTKHVKLSEVWHFILKDSFFQHTKIKQKCLSAKTVLSLPRHWCEPDRYNLVMWIQGLFWFN